MIDDTFLKENGFVKEEKDGVYDLWMFKGTNILFRQKKGAKFGTIGIDLNGCFFFAISKKLFFKYELKQIIDSL
jgi:hypothetical protein